jgi:hypothetical protein
MRASSIAAVVLTLTLGATLPAYAQDRSGSSHLRTLQELVLTDGSHVYGTVERESSSEVEFRTMVGALLTTPRDQILTIRPVVGRMIGGEFRREDPNNTRLLFGPTGRALAKGEVYLGVYEALMPFVQVGITDRVSIGAGTPLIFNVDDWDRLYWLTPKVQVFSGNGIHVAAGVFHGVAGDDHAGIAYGVVTRELKAGAFTIGAGLGYNSDGSRGGVLMIGGEAPVRRNIKWVTENYVWDSAVVSSGGFRFFGERLSADLALGFVINGEDPVIPFPVVNFVYRF